MGGERPKKEEKEQQRKHRSPKAAYALKEKAELATLGLRKDFRRMATESKAAALDTFHTRTGFQRSAIREERHCFLSLALPHSVWTANSVRGKLSWSEHKPSDHGFDPSVSLLVLPHRRPGAATSRLHSPDRRGRLPRLEEGRSLLKVGLIQFNTEIIQSLPGTGHWIGEVS